MKIKDIVSFHDDRFFEGAVQLGWAQKRRGQAKLAAESFVFHGPKYHGAEVSTNDSLNKDYQLKDTANFTLDLLKSIENGMADVEVNPYWLIVAGYGSGKSHLALTLSTILSEPRSESSQKVIKHLIEADNEIGCGVKDKLSNLIKPALILPLDGMSGFHLGNALNKAVFEQLKYYDIDSTPVRALSPRFKLAEDFVERNFDIRSDTFSEKLPGLAKEDISAKLSENDEDVYFKVDEVFTLANGNSIPVDGHESAQDLINLLAEYYCGIDGPFSTVIILFDEFGRYLEYAGDKPHLAGDSSLQQIFQGIQDNNKKIKFLGFIQYELKEYLKRFSGQGLRQLQRYITRFEASEKLYLSTNLETIFAHMIDKNAQNFDSLWGGDEYKENLQKTHLIMSQAIKSFNEYPVWADEEKFEQVVYQGCWPIHPLAVWFLSRQKDIVQSRSALSFIKESILSNNDLEVVNNSPVNVQISVAEIVLRNMLPELISAERDTGGAIAETVQSLLEKFDSYITVQDKLTLVSIAILEKLKIGKKDKTLVNAMISQASALSDNHSETSLKQLAELGALEWNVDLGKYELLTDGASRAQFQQWLRTQKSQVSEGDILNLFLKKAHVDLSLKNIDTSFGLENDIKTTDWFFESSYTTFPKLAQSIKSAFKDWQLSSLPKEAKGQVIYLYLRDESISEVEVLITESFRKELNNLQLEKAPIWIIAIPDNDSIISEKLIYLHVLEDKIDMSDQEKYRRFISDEVETSKDVLREQAQIALKQKMHWISGFQEQLKGRDKNIAKDIFKKTYTKIIPYMFDGFTSTTAGRGPKLNSDMTRSLISKQFNGTWIQSQESAIRNRCDAVLKHSWQVLDSQGKLIYPRNDSVRNVIDWLIEIHSTNTSQDLLTTYSTLIKPPFGLNASSASLIIAIFLGLESIQRRIELSGEFISSSDWLSQVFKGSVRNFFNEDTLKKTTIKFLPKNAEARWRELLDKWDLEKKYSNKVTYHSEARVMWSENPIPESLEPQYRMLSNESVEIIGKMKEVESDLDGLSRKIEGVERSHDIKFAVRTGSKLLKLKSRVEDITIWPEIFINDCSNYIQVINNIISPRLSAWIQTQNCSDVTQISDFRRNMDFTARDLKGLGFVNESEALSRQVLSAINRVEVLSQYNRVLSESREYPLIPEATKSTTVRRLRDDIEKGDNLTRIIESASAVLKENEILSITNAIKAKQEQLKLAIKGKQKDMAILFNSPETVIELKNMLGKAEQLNRIFIETADEVEVQDVMVLLAQILRDIESWDIQNTSPERAEEILKNSVELNITHLDIIIENDDIEPPWNVRDIYNNISKQLINDLILKSSNWCYTHLVELKQLTISEMNKVELAFTNLPVFLSRDDLVKANTYLGDLKERILNANKREEQEKVIIWITPYLQLSDFSDMAIVKVKAYLNEIKIPPFSLDMEQNKVLKAVENKLIERLDESDTEDLLTRLKKLPKAKLTEIYKILTLMIKGQ
tara:strand:+ start:2060 stop:6532 length:4473 start_codon:yes stop_codon:yes gene_type:complete